MANLLRRNWRRPEAINTEFWDKPLNQATKWNAEHMFNNSVGQYGPATTTYRNDDENRAAIVLWMADGGRMEIKGNDGQESALVIWRTGDKIYATARTSQATHHFEVESRVRNQQNGWCFVAFSRWYTGNIRKTLQMKLDVGDGRQHSLGDPSSGGAWHYSDRQLSFNEQAGYLSWMNFPSNGLLNWLTTVFFGWLFVWFDGLFTWNVSLDLTPMLEARDTNCAWYTISTQSPEVTYQDRLYHYHFDMPDGVRMARAWIVAGGQGGQGGGRFSGFTGANGNQLGPIRLARKSYDGYIGAGGYAGYATANSTRGRTGGAGGTTTIGRIWSDTGGRWMQLFVMGKWNLQNTLGKGGAGGSKEKDGTPGSPGGVTFYLQF